EGERKPWPTPPLLAHAVRGDRGPGGRPYPRPHGAGAPAEGIEPPPLGAREPIAPSVEGLADGVVEPLGMRIGAGLNQDQGCYRQPGYNGPYPLAGPSPRVQSHPVSSPVSF